MESVILRTSVVFLLLTCNGASRSVETVRRPTRSGRKDFILHDLGTEQPHRGRRATVSAQGPTRHDRRQDDSGSRDSDMDTSHLHIMNAFTSDMNVSIRLKNESFSNLRYGDVRTENLGRPLALNEAYVVSAGNESYTANVSSRVTEVPGRADVFLITDVSVEGQLSDTLSVWDRHTPLPFGFFWLLSYNAFSHSGLDVLVFDATKIGTDDYSLHRTGMDIESFDAYYVELEEATYEVKVVAHNMVRNIDDFKNTPSLTPPLFIHPKAGERYYTAITGIYQEVGKFQPEYKSVPALPITQPVAYQVTNVVVLNAFPNNSAVEINFPGGHHFKQLHYGQIATAKFNLKRLDAYRMRLGTTGTWFQSHVDVAVPYIDSECVLIADMGIRGALENMILCRSMNDPQIPLDHARIMTYHALNNYSFPVDVLLFDHSKLNDPNQHSLYSIADQLVLGDGVLATLQEGYYEVKVVPRQTIKDSADFENSRSLLPVFSLKLIGGGHYYLVLSGILGNQKYPAMHIVNERLELPTGDSFFLPTNNPQEDSPTYSDDRVVNSELVPTEEPDYSGAVERSSSIGCIVSLLGVAVATLLS